MEHITLNNGIEMPLLGYGVFKVDPRECERCVRDAISVGYRMIDTAQFYANEEGVGKAVAASGLPRDEFFITTKIWITNGGEKRASESIEESLKKLKTDHVDLLLIHQPFGDYYGTYRAMEKAVKEGKARAIGTSNFRQDRFYDLAWHADIKPAINQLETNVFSQQEKMRILMDRTETRLMAWAPMAQGKENFFGNEILSDIGSRYGKSATQVGLRYLTQLGISAIPKSVRIERMRENLDIFDFRLDDAEMQALKSLNIHDGGTRDYTDVDYISRLIAQVF